MNAVNAIDEQRVTVIPGEILTPDESIVLNAGRDGLAMTIENTGDRPIQVGSHYAIAQANPALSLDRDAARGMRLDIPAGTSVRFEPGLSMEVTLVPLAGAAIVRGLRGETVGGRAVDEQEPADG